MYLCPYICKLFVLIVMFLHLGPSSFGFYFCASEPINAFICLFVFFCFSLQVLLFITINNCDHHREIGYLFDFLPLLSKICGVYCRWVYLDLEISSFHGGVCSGSLYLIGFVFLQLFQIPDNGFTSEKWSFKVRLFPLADMFWQSKDVHVIPVYIGMLGLLMFCFWKTYMGVFFWVSLDLVIRNSSLSSVLKFEDDRWNFQGSYVCLSVQKFFPFGIWTFSFDPFSREGPVMTTFEFNKFSHEFEFLADCVWFALQFITPKAYSRIGYTWSLTLRHKIWFLFISIEDILQMLNFGRARSQSRTNRSMSLGGDISFSFSLDNLFCSVMLIQFRQVVNITLVYIQLFFLIAF